MKKALALVLALCMVFAMSTVAFAETGTIKKDNVKIDVDQAQTVIKTAGTYADDSYTVEIPADITIPWGDMDDKTITAKCFAYLAAGSSVDVSVVVGNEMICTNPSITNKLPLQTSSASDDPIHATQEDGVFYTMDTVISISTFAGVPVGEYVAYATYHINYTPGSVA